MGTTGRWLFAAFAATILCFIGSTWAVESSETAIDRAALEIAGHASPAIENLSAARAEMRHLELLVEQQAIRDGAGRQAIAASREEIDHRITSYLALAPAPGQRELWESIHRELSAFDTSLEQTLAVVATRSS